MYGIAGHIMCYWVQLSAYFLWAVVVKLAPCTNGRIFSRYFFGRYIARKISAQRQAQHSIAIHSFCSVVIR